MNKILPCPFCGQKADTSYNTVFKFQVFCINEECFMNEAIMTGCKTEKEAIDKWNNRVEINIR